MGFFSSLFGNKTKINVYANVQHIMEPSNTDLSDTVLYAILSGKSIPGCLLNDAGRQIANKVDAMRKYGIDHYTLGLPSVSYETTVILSESVVAEVIAQDTDNPYGVVVDYHYICPLLVEHVVAPYLTSVRGWVPGTNQITILPPGYETVAYPDQRIGLVDDVTLNEDNTATLSYLIQTYRIISSTKIVDGQPKTTTARYLLDSVSFSEAIDVPAGLYLTRDYCIAGYRPLDQEGNASEIPSWWFYDISSEKYPEISPEYSIDEENNLFPVVPLRYNNQSMIQDTELYHTSKSLLKKIGLNIDDLAVRLESNPSIGDIDNAYITFGVDLQTTHVESIKYLANFFDYIADKSQIDAMTHLQNTLIAPKNSRVYAGAFAQNAYNYITGAATSASVAQTNTTYSGSVGSTTATVTGNESLGTFSEFGLKISITYSYIKSETIVGSIGDVGHATKEFIRKEDSSVYQATTYDDSHLILRVQIAKNLYKQVTIYGLVHRNYVQGSYVVTTTLTDVIDSGDEHNFIIPLHYNLTREMEAYSRSALYQDSLVMVMTSIVYTTVHWYERGFFKALIMIVGIVIACYSGQYWVAGLTAAIEAGAAAVIMFLLENLLISLAVSVALDYVAEWVGPEVMAMLAVVTIAASAYAGGTNAGNISFLGTNMPTAQACLSLSAGMLNAANNELANQLEGVETEYASFLEEKTAALEKIEAALELLKTDTDFSSENLLAAQAYSQTLRQPQVNSPEEFYDLAIHTGNIGTLALYGVSAFHDLALTLPKPDTQKWGFSSNTV